MIPSDIFFTTSPHISALLHFPLLHSYPVPLITLRSRMVGGGGGGGQWLMSPDVLPSPLTPTPAPPLSLFPYWRTHCNVRLLTSFGASGFWHISQKLFLCSQGWNDIQQIWYQQMQENLLSHDIFIIISFALQILNKRWFSKCKVFFLLTRNKATKEDEQ